MNDMDSSFVSIIIQGGAVGLAAFALVIVWLQVKVANAQNKDCMDVIKANAVSNEKVACAVESNTEAVKSLVTIIQTKL